MRPIIITLCLLSMTVSGCLNTIDPVQVHWRSRLEADLRALGPLEVEALGEDRVALWVDVPETVVMAWDRDGRRVAIATRDVVRIIEPDGAEQAAAFEPLEALPRLFWLSDGRLWLAPRSGGLFSPFEADPEPPSPIAGDVRAVDPAGRAVVEWRDRSASGWHLAVAHARGWQRRMAASSLRHGSDIDAWPAPSKAALLGDTLLVPLRDGLFVFDTQSGERHRARWAGGERLHVHAVWSAPGRVCMDFAEGRLIVTAAGQPLQIEPWIAARAVPPEVPIADGCVGAEGAALVVDADGAWLIDASGRRLLDADAQAAAIDPTGSRLATVRSDGVYVGPIDGPARRVADASTTSASVVGVTEPEGDRIWVLRADPALVGRVPGLEASGGSPDIGERVLLVIGGLVMIPLLIWAAVALEDVEWGCVHRCNDNFSPDGG